MKYTTYILLSNDGRKTYVGHTDNLERRLLEHNRGKSLFSRRYVPWFILYQEDFMTEQESIKREKYFKTHAGRNWMKKNLFAV